MASTKPGLPDRPLALVTGGSSGIGLELARQFAAHGFDLVIGGSSGRVDDAASSLRQAGATVVPVKSDLATYDGVEAVWSAVQDTGRPLAAAALNAGIGIGGAFIDTALEDELRMIAINATSQVHLAKRIVPGMVAAGSGRILFTSSLSATTPTPYETVYGPTRAFVYSFAQSLREELLGTGVTVTALLPGATDSEFHQRAGMGYTKFGDNSWKNSRVLVAQKGYEALMAGRDHVIGGDRATWRAAVINKFLPERVKAHRQATMARAS
jgi:short-subunit dehydrogenase